MRWAGRGNTGCIALFLFDHLTRYKGGTRLQRTKPNFRRVISVHRNGGDGRFPKEVAAEGGSCHGVSWYIATVSGKIPVFGIRGISGDILEETKRDRLDTEHNERMIQ